MQPERYIMGYGVGDRQYLIRTEPPRFIADIHPQGSPQRSGNIGAGDMGTIDMGELGVLEVCQWIDAPPIDDAIAIARLARETADAVLEIDVETDRRIDREE